MWTALIHVYHEARVNGWADISAEGVPAFWIKEIPELLKVVGDKKFSGTIVEPRIKFVDDRLIANDGENTYECRYGSDEKKYGDANGWLPALEYFVHLKQIYYWLMIISHD
jgi:hypothetical protein